MVIWVIRLINHSIFVKISVSEKKTVNEIGKRKSTEIFAKIIFVPKVNPNDLVRICRYFRHFLSKKYPGTFQNLRLTPPTPTRS